LGFINVLLAIFLKLCTYLGFLFLFQLREVFGLGLIGVDKRLNLVYFVGHVLVYDIFSLDFFFFANLLLLVLWEHCGPFSVAYVEHAMLMLYVSLPFI
jgi:hypothetical protein